MWRGGRNAYQAGDNDLPILGAMGSPWEFGVDPNSAACRDGECRASIAVGDWDKSGSSGRQLMDSVVAPWHRRLALERRIDTDVKGGRETRLSAQTKDSDCSLKWGWRRIEGRVKEESISEQMGDVQKDPLLIEERWSRARANLTADSLLAVRP